MTSVGDICKALGQLAPVCLAAEWDNVGLLVGDRKSTVTHIMTCLTVTPETIAEAIDKQAGLIVTHHPFPFSPVKTITTDTHIGTMLWQLAQAGISVYSAHTAFDSAAGGINQQIAEALNLKDIKPLVPLDTPQSAATQGLGAGRSGTVEFASLAELVPSLKSVFNIESLHIAGDTERPLTKIGIACGSAGEFIRCASRQGCDVLITGEARFHTCLEARGLGIAMILLGHYASERFALDNLAATLADQFSELAVWASTDEEDPLTLY
jgi:dinuclear metal center YbgI/SA1388 family protein